MKYIRQREPTRAKGFTLIELLTVIGIIAVLATLLMSALSSAKQKARIAKCTSNLRQISLAFNMYFDDYRNRPQGYEELVEGDYLAAKEVLICPEDKSGKWANLVEQNFAFDGFAPSGEAARTTHPLPALEYSYFTPMSWSDPAWERIKRKDGSAGLSACQLHGLGEMNLEFPSLRDFEGLILRAQLDGAVVRRQQYWSDSAFADNSEDAAAPVAADPMSPEAANYPFGLFIDEPGNISNNP